MKRMYMWILNLIVIFLMLRAIILEFTVITFNWQCGYSCILFCACVYLGLFNIQKWSCPEAGEVLKRNGVPDWPLLATYLISEASVMKSSRWSNYISALPQQPYSLLYWWAFVVRHNWHCTRGFLIQYCKMSTLSFPPYSLSISFQDTFGAR